MCRVSSGHPIPALFPRASPHVDPRDLPARGIAMTLARVLGQESPGIPPRDPHGPVDPTSQLAATPLTPDFFSPGHERGDLGIPHRCHGRSPWRMFAGLALGSSAPALATGPSLTLPPALLTTGPPGYGPVRSPLATGPLFLESAIAASLVELGIDRPDRFYHAIEQKDPSGTQGSKNFCLAWPRLISKGWYP